MKFRDQVSCVYVREQLKSTRFLKDKTIFCFRTERYMGDGVISTKIRVLISEVKFCYFSFVIFRFFVVLFNITVVVSIPRTRGTGCRADAGAKFFCIDIWSSQVQRSRSCFGWQLGFRCLHDNLQQDAHSHCS